MNYLEQILGATTHWATAVWSLTFHLKNHPSKTNKTLLEKQWLMSKWRYFMDPYTWRCQCWLTSRTYLPKLCADTMMWVSLSPVLKENRDLRYTEPKWSVLDFINQFLSSKEFKTDMQVQNQERILKTFVIFSYADSCRKNHNDTIIKDEGRLL